MEGCPDQVSSQHAGNIHANIKPLIIHRFWLQVLSTALGIHANNTS